MGYLRDGTGVDEHSRFVSTGLSYRGAIDRFRLPGYVFLVETAISCLPR
jgi:hypothetical protein